MSDTMRRLDSLVAGDRFVMDGIVHTVTKPLFGGRNPRMMTDRGELRGLYWSAVVVMAPAPDDCPSCGMPVLPSVVHGGYACSDGCGPVSTAPVAAEVKPVRHAATVGTVTRVDYAGGVFVTFERMPVGTDGYSDDQRWYYAVWLIVSGNHADVIDHGYARTRAEAQGYARTARQGIRAAGGDQS